MLDSEIRETVLLSISLILLAIVLGFIAVMGRIKSDMADVRREELDGAAKVAEYREYNRYDKKMITGDEVIECMLQNYDSENFVVVNYRKNTVTGQVINDTSVVRSAGVITDDPRVFSMYQYLKHPDYFEVATSEESTANNVVQNWFPTDRYYCTFLLYNGENYETKLNQLIADYKSINVSSLNTPQKRFDRLIAMEKQYIADSEVTGILIIDLVALV